MHFKLEMKKYFDDKYKIESMKEYSIATLVDPHYKSAGFRSKESAGIAKNFLFGRLLQTSKYRFPMIPVLKSKHQLPQLKQWTHGM